MSVSTQAPQGALDRSGLYFIPPPFSSVIIPPPIGDDQLELDPKSLLRDQILYSEDDRIRMSMRFKDSEGKELEGMHLCEAMMDTYCTSLNMRGSKVRLKMYGVSKTGEKVQLLRRHPKNINPSANNIPKYLEEMKQSGVMGVMRGMIGALPEEKTDLVGGDCLWLFFCGATVATEVSYQLIENFPDNKWSKVLLRDGFSRPLVAVVSSSAR